jgi:multidrug efflux pump subunit AcrA (membrane-fusion protein)
MARNATSKVALEEAELRFVSSKNNYQAARQRWVQRQAELEDRLAEAQIEYRLAAEEKGNALIESRIDGKIYSIVPEVGEMVSSNQPLALLGDSGQFLLKLTVDERDIAKVKTRQEVVFSMDVLPDTTLRAHISKIYPSMNQEDRTFTVEAEVAQTSLPLYAGASVEANIVIQQKENALVIPQAALMGGDSVMVEQDGERKKVKVRKGAENLSMVEVMFGLSENSKIILP